MAIKLLGTQLNQTTPFFFIGNRKLGNSDRFLAGNRQPQKKNRQPGGPILGPANLGNFQISRKGKK